MENKTEMGLLLIIFGMVLSIFGTLGGVAAGSYSGSTFSPGAIIPAILGFFAIILMFVGWIILLIGRKEFGEEHDRFVMYSLIAFIVGVVIVIIGGIVSAIGLISGGFGGLGDEADIDYPGMVRGMISGLIISEIGGIFLTVGAIFLVYKLENDTGKRILFLALIASIIISIVSMIYISSVMEELADKLEDTPEDEQEDEFTEGMSELSAMDGVGVIGLLLLLIGYFIPYNRIKKGELKPVTMLPRPYGMPPYPPQQPYQPYPPYQPPYQPPQQPGKMEGMTQPEPKPETTAQPKVVSPVQVGIKNCMYCNSQIPENSTTCPVCKKELRQ